MENNEVLTEGGGGEVAPEAHIEEPPSLSETVREAFEQVKADSEPEGGEKTVDRPSDRGDGRDPRGRFAGKATAAAPGEAGTASFQQPQTAQAHAAPQFQPPHGWDAAAKAKFGELPAEVQQAVARREEEVNRGFQILQNYRGLEEFHPYIARAGTTYRDVMGKALAWEQATIADPIGAIAHLCQIRGIPPQLAAQALLDPKIAAQVRAQNPYARGPQPQRPQQPPPIDPNTARQIAREEFARANLEQKTSDEVASFLKNPSFPHVARVVDDMVLMIRSGRARGLQDAYQMAVRLHNLPQTVNSAGRASAVNQARRAAKAVTGAPIGGQTPGAEQPTSAKTVRSAARIAYDRALGGV